MIIRLAYAASMLIAMGSAFDAADSKSSQRLSWYLRGGWLLLASYILIAGFERGLVEGLAMGSVAGLAAVFIGSMAPTFLRRLIFASWLSLIALAAIYNAQP